MPEVAGERPLLSALKHLFAVFTVVDVRVLKRRSFSFCVQLTGFKGPSTLRFHFNYSFVSDASGLKSL